MPLVLTDRVRVEVDYSTTLTCLKVSGTHSIPRKDYFSFFGHVGYTQGQAPFNLTLNFAVPVAGLEVDFDALNARPGGFAVTLTRGDVSLTYLNCTYVNETEDNDPEAGVTTYNVNLTAGSRTKVGGA